MAFVILEILTFAQMGFMAVGIVLYFITPKEKRKDVAEIGWLFVIGLITDIGSLSTYYLKLSFTVNYWSNAHGFVVIPILANFYKRKIMWSQFSVITNLITIVYVAFAITNYFFIQKDSINSYTLILKSTLVLAVAITYLYYRSKQEPAIRALSLPAFWISIALIIHNSVHFVFSLLTNYLIHVVKSDMILPFIIFHCFQLVYYWIIWIALWLNKNQKMSHVHV